MSSKQFLLPVLALALFTASPAPADPPAPASAAASASASAAADASAAPSPSALALPLVYFVGPPPAEKSKVPTVAEWAVSEEIKLARGTSSCTTALVREWFRVRCAVVHALNVQLLAGTQELYYSFTPRTACYPGTGTYGDEGYCEDRVETIFPLRRGDRRVIEITTRMGGGYAVTGGVSERGWAVISEAWPDDEPAPSISIAQ